MFTLISLVGYVSGNLFLYRAGFGLYISLQVPFSLLIISHVCDTVVQTIQCFQCDGEKSEACNANPFVKSGDGVTVSISVSCTFCLKTITVAKGKLALNITNFTAI